MLTRSLCRLPLSIFMIVSLLLILLDEITYHDYH